VETSRATYLTAIAAATTPAEKQAARLALDASLSGDLNARIAAITAAGDPPSPPAGYNGTVWVEGFQAANVAFRASIVTAQTALSQSLATATTAWDRKAARLTYNWLSVTRWCCTAPRSRHWGLLPLTAVNRRNDPVYKKRRVSSEARRFFDPAAT